MKKRMKKKLWPLLPEKPKGISPDERRKTVINFADKIGSLEIKQ